MKIVKLVVAVLVGLYALAQAVFFVISLRRGENPDLLTWRSVPQDLRGVRGHGVRT